jgi:DNA-binding LytR/AlgR family response regulator
MARKTAEINKYYRLFRIKGSRRLRMLDISTICFVTVDDRDGRNKKIITINGEKLILSNYRLERLFELCQQLIQVNKHTLLSPAIIKEKDSKFLYLSIRGKGSPVKVTLSRLYMKEIRKLIG